MWRELPCRPPASKIRHGKSLQISIHHISSIERKHGSLQALLLNKELEAHFILMHFSSGNGSFPRMHWESQVEPTSAVTNADTVCSRTHSPFLHVSSRALALHILWKPLLFHTFPFYLRTPMAGASCAGMRSDGLQAQQSYDLHGDSFILFDPRRSFGIRGSGFHCGRLWWFES